MTTKIPVELSSTPSIVDGGNATAITIDSSENVGIGTTSPADTLHIVTDSSTTNDTVDVARIEATSSGTPAVGFGPTIDFRGERGSASSDSMGRIGYVADTMTASRIDGAFIVETAVDGTYSEHLRVTSTGNVGIGTTSPTRPLHINSSEGRLIRLTHASKPKIEFVDTTNGTSGAYISSEDNELMFETSGQNERMRIDSSGNVGIGITPVSSVGLYVDSGANYHAGVFRVDTAAYAAIICDNQDSSGTRYFASFRLDNTEVGKITSTGSSTVYATSSDYRLKENVNYEFDALTRVKQLKPARFNFIADETNTLVDGFLAHEVSDIVPEAITGEKDGEEMQGIDQSKLVPLLTKAMQEQQTLIETQQTTINDLKSRIETLEG